MVTYQELTQAISELRASQEETSNQIKESKAYMESLSDETNKQIRETSKLVKALSQNIDGVNKSIGLEAEEFFYSSLKKNPRIGNIDFDYVYQNSKRDFKGETQEIDILLENGSSVGVVEVKNRVSQKSIDQLDKIMDRFNYFHPLYKDYKVIGAIAGKIFPKHLQEQTLSKGYSVILQQGDHTEQINPTN